MFTGAVPDGRVVTVTFFCWRLLLTGKFVTVPSVLKVYPVDPVWSMVKLMGPTPIGDVATMVSPE